MFTIVFATMFTTMFAILFATMFTNERNINFSEAWSFGIVEKNVVDGDSDGDHNNFVRQWFRGGIHTDATYVTRVTQAARYENVKFFDDLFVDFGFIRKVALKRSVYTVRC